MMSSANGTILLQVRGVPGKDMDLLASGVLLDDLADFITQKGHIGCIVPSTFSVPPLLNAAH